MSGKKSPAFPWQSLLAWYEDKGRHHLPWRDYTHREILYRVWLSEILLQQTQVDRVIPYLERILTKYPTIHDLAQASYEEFFPYYQGMGYYSRARNILRTAKIVSEEYKGIFPMEKKILQKLPGVGGYTSSAILAFGYGEPHLTWDTNLEKVFARYSNGRRDMKLNEEEKEKIEEDFRIFVSEEGLKLKAKNGETEGDKLFESDDSNILMSEANEFLSPSGAFGTFQSGKVRKEKSGFLPPQEGQEQSKPGFPATIPGNDGNTGLLYPKGTSNASQRGATSQGLEQGEGQKALVRAINNALMDFAATVDIKNPDNIDWENYPIQSGLFYETRGALEPREEKKSRTFPIPDAAVMVILHQDHRDYYTSHDSDEYTPFVLLPSLHRDTRLYVQEYFRQHHLLELSVRPVHAKWLALDGRAYIAVNAQIQAGDREQFNKIDKKTAQEVLKKMIP